MVGDQRYIDKFLMCLWLCFQLPVLLASLSLGLWTISTSLHLAGVSRGVHASVYGAFRSISHIVLVMFCARAVRTGKSGRLLFLPNTWLHSGYMFMFSSGGWLLDVFPVFSQRSGALILRSIHVLLGMRSPGFCCHDTPCAVFPSIVGWLMPRSSSALAVVCAGLVLLVLMHVALCGLWGLSCFAAWRSVHS